MKKTELIALVLCTSIFSFKTNAAKDWEKWSYKATDAINCAAYSIYMDDRLREDKFMEAYQVYTENAYDEFDELSRKNMLGRLKFMQGKVSGYTLAKGAEIQDIATQWYKESSCEAKLDEYVNLYQRNPKYQQEITLKWQDKLKLKDKEMVVFINQFDAGHLGQEERKHYNIVNELGEKVGSVKYIEYTDTNAPFNRSYSLQQFDLENNTILSLAW